MNDIELRDYFAAKAMQGIVASNSDYYDGNHGGCKVPSAVAEDAYELADAMLKQRVKKWIKN